MLGLSSGIRHFAMLKLIGTGNKASGTVELFPLNGNKFIFVIPSNSLYREENILFTLSLFLQVIVRVKSNLYPGTW